MKATLYRYRGFHTAWVAPRHLTKLLRYFPLNFRVRPIADVHIARETAVSLLLFLGPRRVFVQVLGVQLGEHTTERVIPEWTFRLGEVIRSPTAVYIAILGWHYSASAQETDAYYMLASLARQKLTNGNSQ